MVTRAGIGNTNMYLLVYDYFFLYFCRMAKKLKESGKKYVVDSEEELGYIVKLFSEKYKELDHSADDLNCFANEELSLVRQPKCVTYSDVEATLPQHRVLVETIRCLQPYMTRSAFEIFTLREKYNFFVNVDFSKMEYFCEHVSERKEFLRGLQNLRFTFGWQQRGYTDKNGMHHDAVNYEYNGYIYIGHITRSDSSVCCLQVNPMALPYLLFIGKDMLFTEFNYNVYRQLKSLSSRQLYFKVCDWSAQGNYRKVTVDELKKFVGSRLSNISLLKNRVLDATRDQLFNLDSDVVFDYVPVKESVNGGKSSIVGFEFFFSSKRSSVLKWSEDVRGRFLQQQFELIADPEKRPYARSAVSAVLKSSRADLLLNKFSYYLDKLGNREIRESEYKATMLKILRENHKDAEGNPLDLRSELHIRNSMRRKARNIVEGGEWVTVSN